MHHYLPARTGRTKRPRAELGTNLRAFHGRFFAKADITVSDLLAPQILREPVVGILMFVFEGRCGPHLSSILIPAGLFLLMFLCLMDGWMDGWMHKWMDGRMHGRTDGRTDDLCMNACLLLACVFVCVCMYICICIYIGMCMCLCVHV